MLRGHGMKVADTGARQLGPRSSRMGTLEDPARRAAGPIYRTRNPGANERTPWEEAPGLQVLWVGGRFCGWGGDSVCWGRTRPASPLPMLCWGTWGLDTGFQGSAAHLSALMYYFSRQQPDFHALQTQLRCSTQCADPSCYLAAASPALSNPTQGSTRRGYVVAPAPASLGVPPPQTREPQAHSRCTSHDCAVCRRPARTENVAT